MADQRHRGNAMGNGVVGVWTLRSFHMENVETKERSEPFGPGVVAYSGRYRLEPPNRIVTSVDVSWFEEWIGTDQARTYVLEDDRLDISTPPGRMPQQGGGEMSVMGVMSWTRETPTQGG